MSEHQPYKFERGARRDPRSPEGQIFVSQFLARLRPAAPSIGRMLPEDRALVEELICHVHLNINWYDAALTRLRDQQRLFNGLTYLVVAGFVGVTLGSSFREGAREMSSVAVIASVIAALLKLLSDLSKAEERYSNAATASKDLKTALYKMEDEVAQGTLPAFEPDNSVALRAEFRLRLRQEISAARVTVHQQEEDYFKLLTAPTKAGTALESLRNTLTDAPGRASALWKSAERGKLTRELVALKLRIAELNHDGPPPPEGQEELKRLQSRKTLVDALIRELKDDA